MFYDLLLDRHPTTATLEVLKKSKDHCLQQIIEEVCDLKLLEQLCNPNHIISKILGTGSKEHLMLIEHRKKIFQSLVLADNFFSKKQNFSDDITATIIDYIGGNAAGLSFFYEKKQGLNEKTASANCACSIS